MSFIKELEALRDKYKKGVRVYTYSRDKIDTTPPGSQNRTSVQSNVIKITIEIDSDKIKNQ